ncbi:hypothetical protein VUR80DRAFT_3270 [Thermomyces stellatus]
MHPHTPTATLHGCNQWFWTVRRTVCFAALCSRFEDFDAHLQAPCLGGVDSCLRGADHSRLRPVSAMVHTVAFRPSDAVYPKSYHSVACPSPQIGSRSMGLVAGTETLGLG